MVGEPAPPAGPLVFDAALKNYDAKRGETNASISFPFANVAGREVVLQTLRPTCPCTVASVGQALPWRMQAGETGRVEVNVDLRDRWEPFKQTIAVETSAVTNQIELLIRTPELTPREKNRRRAFADRQAVFKGDCAKCHLNPAAGQPVAIQYQVLCGTCHDAADRAEMVPALETTSKAKDRLYWEEWLRRGKPGTFMPAFAKRYGGPLNDDELERMIQYVAELFAK
jgi:mono/diheme cytochrome c family protein